jgi:hypothetical protein
MGEMGGPVDRAYLVSVEDLREICSGLTNKKREYRLTCEGERKVAIFFNEGPDDLNAVGFTFPIIVDIWTLGILAGNEEAGFMVCLHVYTKKQIRRGLYFEDAELKWDGIEDWEKFWTPLEAVLIKGMECRSW